MSVSIRVVEYCADTRSYWLVEAEPALCANATHHHQRFESHMHRTIVQFPTDFAVMAVSFDKLAPYERDNPPDYGLYFDAAWSPPWPHELIEWPDFGLPANTGAFTGSLQQGMRRAQRGERVEIGCLGAHGRTGTALACLAILCGVRSDDAVRWVRDNYCADAVETEAQESFVAAFGGKRIE